MLPVLAKVSLTLVIGALGGYLLSRFNVPLAWMLGAMLATTVAAFAHLPIAPPNKLRPGMKAVIGCMLGASFSAELLAQVGQWGIPVLGLLGASLVGASAGYLVLRHVGRLDPITAYFGSLPGGLTEMTILGDEKGGDVKSIVMIHTIRVFSVVLLLPLLLAIFTDVGDYGNGAAPALAVRPDLEMLFWFAVSLVGGMMLGRLLRLPSADMLGPMLISGVAHLLGWTDFKLPAELVAAAQVVLGVHIGTRFMGAQLGSLMKLATTAFITMAVHLSIAVLAAFLVSTVTPFDIITLILAYSPAGVTEMSLIAIAVGMDVAFVATHHLVRIVAVLLAGPTVFAITAGRGRNPP